MRGTGRRVGVRPHAEGQCGAGGQAPSMERMGPAEPVWLWREHCLAALDGEGPDAGWVPVTLK